MAKKYILGEDRMPTSWYNLTPDLPTPPPPPLHPGTLQPAGPADLAPLFPMALIMQEVSMDSYIEIPEEVQEIYKIWRPTPLIRALQWEKALGTPAKIFYKYEGVSPAGSHKPNTSVPQAYYNKAEGTMKLSTETGAGQWGSSLAMATSMFGLECLVYMVKVSYYQKPYRRSMMNIWGAECIPSPSETTESGRMILARDPETPGSLGIAISEAVEVAAKNDDTHYALGSVLNHVMLHQTDHRPGSPHPDGRGRPLPRHRHRVRGRRLELRRHRVPVHRREGQEGSQDPHHRLPSRRRARR